MNVLLVYALLLKATCTTFSGLASLPIVRQDFVLHRHAITDRQLNTAVAAGRSGPGPLGVYVVAVGYYAAGVPGAVAGTLALITPAFFILPLLIWIGNRADHPVIRRVIRSLVLASAGLLAATALRLGIAAVTDGFQLALAGAALLVYAGTRIESFWVMLLAAAAGFARACLR